MPPTNPNQPPLVRARVAIGALTVGLGVLLGVIQKEGYTDRAIIPVKGDRPTVGFGSTFKPDGSPVKMGDTITPQDAVKHVAARLEKAGEAVRRCVKVPLFDREFQVAVSMVDNVGEGAFCGSTMVRLWNRGEYEAGCNELSRWVYVKGVKIQGLVNRREQERLACLGLGQ